MRKTLGELCDIVSGGTPARSNVEFWNNGTIPWLKIGNIKGKYVSEADEFITQAGLNSSSAKMLSKGTLLYTIFATLGETGILTFDACTNQAIVGLTIKDPTCVLTEYLYYYLKSKKPQVNNIGRGVAQNNINISMLKSFEVTLPDVEKQQGITNVLNKIENIIAWRKQQLHTFDNLIKARFVEMFGDEKCHMALCEVCSIITDGTHQPPKFHDKGIPFIFVSNITENKVTYDAEKYIDQETYDELIKRTPIEIGDILLSTVGSYGHPAVVKTDKKFLFQRHIAYLKPRKELVDSDYLHGSILSPDVQRQIDAGVKGIAQKTLNLSEIKKITIPVPDIKRQKQFAAFVSQVHKSKSAVQAALDKAQLLFDSLMQEYFG